MNGDADCRSSDPPAQDDQMLVESKILGGGIGFLGDKSADEGSNDPEKKHRHLIMLRNRNRCRSILGLAQM